MKNIQFILEDKKLLHDRIYERLVEELNNQKKSGKKFISDEEIDTLINEILKNEI